MSLEADKERASDAAKITKFRESLVQMLTFRRLTLILTCLLSGCQSPFLLFPGGALQGNSARTDTFAFADAYSLIQLEVNPDEPYSVILRCVVISGDLYLDAAPARKWGQLIEGDPRVKVKLGDEIYKATAITVTESSIREQFFEGRNIYRLEPGWRLKSPTAQ
ncbi:MAG: hypothetical protein JJ934_15780 [Pseudomonadales bacterium]|nr:hypothetical protein [Pseudomonadales bacterium]MBO6563909.1 hypothetical protein [Pseudomonadales bacterium]MBO6594801.1 hypothetical protein [Pseudomonadales bacterium]MBO6658354.1 hypothetical protein [Pseudomonadales bacterium]MBO6701306.1 hypothetical protein [Pseudomonadales bacterium]